MNIFAGESGIVLRDFVFRPSFSKQINNEFDCETGALHDRLSHQDFRIENNTFLPFHLVIDHSESVWTNRDLEKSARPLMSPRIVVEICRC